MPHSERHEELAHLLVLGLLDPEEARESERHLDEGCRVCEDLLVELRQSAAALAASVPARRPGPEVRQRILDSLGPSRSAGPARPSERAAPSKPRAFSWLAAAAAVLAAVLLIDDLRLRSQRESLSGRAAELAARVESQEAELARRDLRARVLESEDVRMLFLGGKDPQPRARGKVFWSEKAKRGILIAANLESLPAGRQYQLWVFDKGKPVPAGVFDVDAQGRALFESPDLSAIAEAENFAVTIEPRGGVLEPTGPIVLAGV